MQAALSIASPLLPNFPPSKNFSQPLISSSPRLGNSTASRGRHLSIKAVATYDTSTVDYSSILSVFPAEACETLGGDACRADIYPEVKLKAEAKARNDSPTTELIDREYLQVFCAEACDDLGGEFCSREYQRGVY